VGAKCQLHCSGGETVAYDGQRAVSKSGLWCPLTQKEGFQYQRPIVGRNRKKCAPRAIIFRERSVAGLWRGAGVMTGGQGPNAVSCALLRPGSQPSLSTIGLEICQLDQSRFINEHIQTFTIPLRIDSQSHAGTRHEGPDRSHSLCKQSRNNRIEHHWWSAHRSGLLASGGSQRPFDAAPPRSPRVGPIALCQGSHALLVAQTAVANSLQQVD